MELFDENAFNVIEIELGFMYDLVYTKAPAIYTPWGFVRRFITFFLTCLVFTFFILDDKFRHNRTDFVVTLLLLVVAIFLEIYAALIVLASDQTRVWLIKKRMTSITELIFYHVKKKSEEFEIPRKEQELRSTSSLETALWEVCSQRGKGRLDKYKEKIGQVDLEWSISVEFDQSILTWHMATDICYYSENLSDDVKLSRDFSLHMSRYMCYLLVIRPSLLSDRIDIMRIRHTRADARKFVKENMPTTSDEGGWAAALPTLLRKKWLASRLNTISDPKIKWDLMRDMWLELLAYAACHSRDSQHGQQLRRGGELLTHVWLLMAHFGLTEQCQISPSHARARLVTK
ncbi:hypothetical protein SLEP1_g25690 [Rubroshorea leprosula]|uniref:DUF4220 domain-containing protein n=1 Tax=Rubroshorea leprosula TaxID=152421 RepID=A0AAV5JUA1_9ROSI|nr:hypothetical protein SLEP1_g25690 [Rubroshorea leprosula]